MSNPFVSAGTSHTGKTFYPIVFIRGYAMSQADIEGAVNDPFSGFEKGSTKCRQGEKGEIEPYYFESPVLRLVTEYEFQDVYRDGREPANAEELGELRHPERALWVYRYYEKASEVFGDGERNEIEEIARGLDEMIERLRDLYTRLGEQRGVPYGEHFKVQLIAHSMGGLVVRSYLQKVYPERVREEERPKPVPVDKVFTYGTPHNGIEIKGLGNFINIGLFDISNFYRPNMRKYLGLPGDAREVNDLNGHFDSNRIFCLIGTNPHDYDVRISAAAVGPLSDGLVRIDNAWVKNAPRAHVYRAHGGPTGLVNSEDGYRNLQRFLFGDVRVDGSLEIRKIELPLKIAEALDKGKRITGNFYFDNVVSVRGAVGWNLSRRRYEEGSSVRREFNDLFQQDKGFVSQSMTLFSSFLDTKMIIGRQQYMAFAVDLRFLVESFKVDGFWFFDASFDGLTYFLSRLIIQVMPKKDGEPWKLKYSYDGAELGFKSVDGKELRGGRIEFRIPVENKSRPGIEAELVLRARHWE